MEAKACYDADNRKEPRRPMEPGDVAVDGAGRAYLCERVYAAQAVPGHEDFTASSAFRLALDEYRRLTNQVDLLEGMADLAWQERKVELRVTVGLPLLGNHWVGVQFKGYDLFKTLRSQINRVQKRRRYLRPLLLEANALAASMHQGKKVTLTLPRTVKEKGGK